MVGVVVGAASVVVVDSATQNLIRERRGCGDGNSDEMGVDATDDDGDGSR